MSDKQRLSNLIVGQWPYLVLLGLLFGLALWTLIPGNVLKNPRNNSKADLSRLEQQKVILIKELETLDEALDTATCEGDFLTLPDGSKAEDLLPPGISTDPSTIDIVATLEKSTVEVFNISQEAGGTGFFITKNLILTNAHIVANAGKGPIAVRNKYIGLQEAQLYYEGNDLEDFAIIKIKKDVGNPLKFKILEPQNSKLTKVFASGFPGVVVDSDQSFFPDLNITRGEISSEQKLLNEIDAYFHTAKISSGNSGGPLTDECGNVLGINTFTINSDTNIAYFIALKSNEIIKFLDQNKIRPLISSSQCKE